MYFDAVVVFVTSQTLLFRLALAILWAPSFGMAQMVMVNLDMLILENYNMYKNIWIFTIDYAPASNFWNG